MSTTQLCVSMVVFGPKVRQSDNCNMILNKRFDQPVLRHCIALFYKKKTSENHFLMATGINSQQRSIFYRNVNEKIRHNAYPSVSLQAHFEFFQSLDFADILYFTGWLHSSAIFFQSRLNCLHRRESWCPMHDVGQLSGTAIHNNGRS